MTLLLFLILGTSTALLPPFHEQLRSSRRIQNARPLLFPQSASYSALFASTQVDDNVGRRARTTSKTSSGSNKSKRQQIGSGKKEQLAEPCNVVFTHTNADFDSFAAAVALSLLWNHENPDLPTHVVLPRGVNPGVQRFLAFHKHLLPVRGFKTILPEDVHAIGVVDAQSANRIGRGQAWLEQAKSIHVFDHHDTHSPSQQTKPETKVADKKSKNQPASLLDIATEAVIDKVGSTTTLLVERLKEAGISPAPHEATLFVLGIRADTGGLVYEGTTVRDAAALLWCLENGASQVAISEFGVSKVTEEQRAVLHSALAKTQTKTYKGLRLSSVLVSPSDDDQYVAGLAQVAEEILELTNSDVFLMGATHRSGSGSNKKKKKEADSTQWVSLIGRASARAAGVDLNHVMRRFGGGGHPKAAAASVRCQSIDISVVDGEKECGLELDECVEMANEGNLQAEAALSTALTMVESQIPEQLVASSCMVPASHVITVSVEHTVAAARKIFDDYDLRSAPVVEGSDMKFRSSLKLNDLVKACRAGRNHEKLKGMIRPSVTTVLPDTPLADLEDLMIHKGVGRIPVVDDDGILVGLITRTDVLKQQKLYETTDLDLWS